LAMVRSQTGPLPSGSSNSCTLIKLNFRLRRWPACSARRSPAKTLGGDKHPSARTFEDSMLLQEIRTVRTTSPETSISEDTRSASGHGQRARPQAERTSDRVPRHLRRDPVMACHETSDQAAASTLDRAQRLITIKVH
jgi:hypothetical protein